MATAALVAAAVYAADANVVGVVAAAAAVPFEAAAPDEDDMAPYAYLNQVETITIDARALAHAHAFKFFFLTK